MNRNEFYNLLKENFNISDNTILKIEKYKIFLQEQNKIHNLTRLDSESNIYGNYFYDSIIPYKNLNWNDISTVLDVGSGSGIPGIILKILYPHIKLTIVESITKKINFLKQLSEILEINDIEFLNKRVEEIDKKYKNSFDLVTARAVAELYILLELLIPYMNDNGICIIPKGKKVNEEIQKATEITRKLKIELFQKDDYMSNNGYKEYILIYKKKAKTPSIYPRKWKSIISKK